MKQYYTKFHLICDLLSVFCLIAVGVFLVVQWPTLPELIPSHFSLSGEPDAWSGKSSLLFMPLIALGLFILITVLSCFPRIWNMPVAVTSENREQAFTLTKDMMGMLNLLVVAMFTYISFMQMQARPLSIVGMIVFFVLMTAAIVIYYLQVRRLTK